ncbi:phosphoglycerate mutase [Litchfieldella qijiaojingensis]|uniref:Phosphoglycerate mutase n=1 Tax=Litchfieldella qijiaojingensis TaxID=980347 RepID=A0ABQ2YGQ0_9GAMM|nr:histidine phosphatase family protein [Halomonas qijiaojingensis]GGX82518.1 phosphoglycerate mutase [Halomonas qijiaojingensis]
MAAAGRLDLVVVRHGLTAWNRERRYQGHRDIPLVPEAYSALAMLRDDLPRFNFDAVHCSDLTRCRQTLEFLLKERKEPTKPRFDARLRELDFGDYEGKCYDELKDLPAYRAWIESRGEQAPPGGESTAALRKRLEAWLSELFDEAGEKEYREVLMVTHGGVIRELRRRFEVIDFWEGSVGQGEGRRLTFLHRHGDWQCSSSSAVPMPASARR